MDLLFTIMLRIVWLVPMLLFIGWIINMADPHSSWAVTRVANKLSDPYFRRVRGLLPTIGMLDLSPLVIVILAWIVQFLLRMLAPL
jgi:uncharacterized protein YggT (Ycf19 family)